MNKAFLRGLVVAAVLLINCTLLSGFIERQMTAVSYTHLTLPTTTSV